MASEIKAKYGSSTALTITLASLGSSSTAGRQSTLVDNTSVLAQLVHIYWKITTGTSPTANRSIRLFLIKADAVSANLRTDNAGASDAALTIVAAKQIDAVITSSVSDTAYLGDIKVYNPGPSWGIAVMHDTGVNLNSTGGNHSIRYVVENPESQ